MPVAPDPETFARCIAAGGVAVFPADTVFGLACDPEDGAAVARLYAQRACAVGTRVDLREFAGADHNGIVGAARQDALTWSADRLSGDPASDTC